MRKLQNVESPFPAWLFLGYLVFTACFYSYRILNGLGSAESIYDVDVPTWVRVSKDVIWFGFIALVMILSGVERKRLAWRNVRNNGAFFFTLSAFVTVFVWTGWIHLFFYQSAGDSFLYWYRYPLEYIPIVFLLPIVVDDWQRMGRVAIFLACLSLLFLCYEMVSGASIGFVNRYGSIFGSPNDFGLFCAVVTLGLLVLGRSYWHWALAALMVCGLFLSLSRSAIAGFAVGLLCLLYLKRVRMVACVGVCLIAIVATVILSRYPETLEIAQIASVSEHFGADESAMQRVDELQTFEQRFGQLRAGPILVGTDYFHAESWYMALLIRTGIVGLVLWFAVIGQTIARGLRLRRISKVHSAATAAVLAIAVASIFLPYPDVFPSNFYLWLAIGIVWLPANVGYPEGAGEMLSAA